MKNVHFSARPFYLISKTLGMLSYSYEGSFSNGVMKESIYGLLWSWMSLGIFILIFVLNSDLFKVSASFSNDTLPSKILATGWISSLVISLITLFVAKIYQLSQQRSIVKFLEAINEFDNEVKKIQSCEKKTDDFWIHRCNTCNFGLIMSIIKNLST